MIHFDKHIFAARIALPVAARYMGRDQWVSTGISHGDYNNMSTRDHKGGSGERRLATPQWAMDDKKTAEVICCYLENRVFSDKQKAGLPKGSLADRLERATDALKKRAEASIRTLDSLCARYVAAKSEGDELKARMLNAEIETVDTFIRTCDDGPAFLAGIIYFYHRARMNSVEVGAEVKLKPTHVRQVLWRLNKVAIAPGGRARCGRTCAGCGNLSRSNYDKWCEECRVARLPATKPPRVCVVCGKLCPKRKSKYCSESCKPKRKKQRRPRVARAAFCSPACKETFQHPDPDIPKATNGFGVSHQEALDSGNGKGYAEYITTAERLGGDPMSFGMWKALTRS
jgi:hypothetical protein